ncbi:MAG: DUF192 domain-containing protein [Nitrososphaeraceae archaeon]|nr:DUF192 domain-containing protein [Nitrososphaeraceae archaeon]
MSIYIFLTFFAKVKLKLNQTVPFLNLDTKKGILFITCVIIIFWISFSQLYAFNLQSNNDTSSIDADFFSNYKKTTISINGINVTMAIASTDEHRIRGLSGIEKMNENEGMLFLFDKPSKQGFWMNKMNFPIDIIWLDSNNKVVHIEKQLEPCKLFLACPVYNPEVDSLYVIELRSGFADDHSIKNDMIINFDVPTKIETND